MPLKWKPDVPNVVINPSVLRTWTNSCSVLSALKEIHPTVTLRYIIDKKKLLWCLLRLTCMLRCTMRLWWVDQGIPQLASNKGAKKGVQTRIPYLVHISHVCCTVICHSWFVISSLMRCIVKIQCSPRQDETVHGRQGFFKTTRIRLVTSLS